MNFSSTADDYARHRRSFAAALFPRLAALGVGLAGQEVLDVGAGTALLARALAARGCRVVAADLSLPLLAAGRETGGTSFDSNAATLPPGPLPPARRGTGATASAPPPASGGGRPRLVAARAEALPFAAGAFDAVVAGQCWHWFERRAAPREIRRVLRPGARAAAVYQTYVPMPGSVAAATEALILRHRPGWRHANGAGVNGQVLRDFQAAGLDGIESFSFDVIETFTRDDWRGFIRTTSAIGPSLPPDRVTAFDAEHARMLLEWPEPLEAPHRVFAAVAREPAGGV